MAAHEHAIEPPVARIDRAAAAVLAVVLMLCDALIFVGLLTFPVADSLEFVAIVFNFVFLVVFASLFYERRFGAITNKAAAKFIGLKRGVPSLTFSDISGFLGEQSLGSFVISFCIFNGHSLLLAHGVAVSALFVGIVFVSAILVVTVSLLKFVWLFRNRRLAVSIPACLLAVIVMATFFQFGIDVGAAANV